VAAFADPVVEVSRKARMPARAVAVPFLIEFEVRVMSRVIKSSASQAVKPGPSPRFVPPQLSQLVDKPPLGVNGSMKSNSTASAWRRASTMAARNFLPGLVDSSVGARCPAPQSMASMAAE
jgi:hypothetical protein